MDDSELLARLRELVQRDEPSPSDPYRAIAGRLKRASRRRRFVRALGGVALIATLVAVSFEIVGGAQRRGDIAGAGLSPVVGSDGASSTHVTAVPATTTTTAEATTRERVVSLPQSANAVVGAAGSWWVATAGDELLRLDPTGARLATIRPHDVNPVAFGGGSSLAAGGAGLWVASSSHADTGKVQGWVGRIDTTSASLVTVTAIAGESPSALAVTTGAVWAAGQHTLWRLEPSKGKVVATYHFDDTIQGITGTDDQLWVANATKSTADRIDTSNGAVVASVLVPASINISLALQNGWLFVASGQSLAVINAATAKVVRTLPLDDQAGAIVAVDTAVWVYTATGLESTDGQTVKQRITHPRAFGALATMPGVVVYADSASLHLFEY